MSGGVLSPVQRNTSTFYANDRTRATRNAAALEEDARHVLRVRRAALVGHVKDHHPSKDRGVDVANAQEGGQPSNLRYQQRPAMNKRAYSSSPLSDSHRCLPSRPSRCAK